MSQTPTQLITTQISGLLVTLTGLTQVERLAVINLLRTRHELTVGEPQDRWLPVALEASDDTHARQIHDWIEAQSGVDYVDVISIHFDHSEAEQPEYCSH